MSYSADSTESRQALDVGRCVNDAIALFKQNWLILVVAAVLFDILVLFSLLILAGPLYGGICLMLLRASQRENKRVDLGDMFRCFDRFGRLLGLFFLPVIPLLIGFVLCFLPGLFLATIWMYPFYLVVDKDLGLFESLRVSKEIVMRKGLGINLFVMVICLALLIVPNVIPYLGIILSWIIAPIAWMIETSAYIQQVHEDNGELADLFPDETVTFGERSEPDIGSSPVEETQP
jgi:uncharacterized membrane protein